MPKCSVIPKYNVGLIIFSITFEFSTQERQIYVKLTCEALNHSVQDRKYVHFHGQDKKCCSALNILGFPLQKLSKKIRKYTPPTASLSLWFRYLAEETTFPWILCNMRTEKLFLIPRNHECDMHDYADRVKMSINQLLIQGCYLRTAILAYSCALILQQFHNITMILINIFNDN